jgi:hypothetical protein
MFKVTFDYRGKDGFLTQGEMFFNTLKAAFVYINSVCQNIKIVGKPTIERV